MLNLLHVATFQDGESNVVEVIVNGTLRKFRVDARTADIFASHYRSKKRHAKALSVLRKADPAAGGEE